MNKNNKKRILGVCLSFMMMLGVVEPVRALTLEHENSDGEIIKLTDFLDTSNHWGHDQIYKWSEYGLIAGYNGYFMPNAPIKRGDLAIIVDRMLGLKSTTYNLFNDLPNDSYYRESILRCVAAGYISGTGTNTVSPDGYATREQVAVIIARMFNLDTGYTGYTGFKDDSQIGSWAKSSVYAMKQLGYMNGDEAGNVMPKSYITRAELVTILSNIANTYIPKSDKSGQGSSFTGKYPTNIITSRNIELSNAIVGRDVVLTPASSSFTAMNTDIIGRLYVMGKNNITLNNTSISQVYLVDGKSTLSGISDDIDEIYVSKYATESILDSIPKCIVLESGVRVKIEDTMYENETNRTKTYYGIDIKADIADEQNFVSGGPKITGTKFEQDQDNTITVSNVIVNKNGTEIKEIGVVWLDQERDTEIINPSCQNYDDKIVYKTNKFTDPISFKVDTVDGTRAYRVYVKDSDGLYAYSDTFTFTEYNFTTSLNIYGENYPNSVDVEIVMQGDSIPDISNIRVVYGFDGIYNEDLEEVALRLYSNPDAEVQPDKSKYRRYIATINSDSERVDGETVYTPPTHFGYIINYKNGTIINKYPVLSNAIPEGVSPMSILNAGSANYSGNNIFISNSVVQTRYVIPQEVGIVYKYSNSESIVSPMNNSSGWNYVSSNVDVGLGETVYYNNTISGNDNLKYTYYAAYVKTSNGYWYSDVHKIANNVKGDEGGPQILKINDIAILEDDSAVISVSVGNLLNTSSLDLTNSYIEYNGKSYLLSSLDPYITSTSEHQVYLLTFKIDSLNSNSTTNCVLRICNKDGLNSNTMNLNISTINPVVITTSKGVQGSGRVLYDLSISKDNIRPLGTGTTVIDGLSKTFTVEGTSNSYILCVNGMVQNETIKVLLHCKYTPENTSKDYDFYVPLLLSF